MITSVIHQEREKYAKRDDKCGQQTVYDKVAGLARHATLKRYFAVTIVLISFVTQLVGVVVAQKLRSYIDVFMQLPNMLV